MNISVTGQVLKVSGRFTDVKSLQFAFIGAGLAFLCMCLAAVKEFSIPTHHPESTRKKMKKTQ